MSLGSGRVAGLRRLLTRSRAIRARHGVSPLRQWRLYRRFHDAIGMDRGEFLGYWLWDERRPLAARMAFISNRERRAIEYRMNPREANLRIRNKAWATDQLERADIPVGEVLSLFSLHPGVTASVDRYPFQHGEAGWRAILAAAPATGIVIKPEDGGGGRSVHVFRQATADALVALDGTEWTAERTMAVLASERLWKVERRLEQHPLLARIAGDTLGTLRIVSFRTLDGTVHLTTTAWKIPIGLSGVDHFSHGAGQLAAEVDDATGRLGPARRWFDDAHTDTHPITGERITGAVMPHWGEAQAVARRVADLFPDLASLGYDIAISAGGPVVIEVNPCWGERSNQAAGLTGMVQGTFRRFLEERGYGDVVNFRARDEAARIPPSRDDGPS